MSGMSVCHVSDLFPASPPFDCGADASSALQAWCALASVRRSCVDPPDQAGTTSEIKLRRCLGRERSSGSLSPGFCLPQLQQPAKPVLAERDQAGHRGDLVRSGSRDVPIEQPLKGGVQVSVA